MKVWILLHGDPESSSIHNVYATAEAAVAAFEAVAILLPPNRKPELQPDADPPYGEYFWHIPHPYDPSVVFEEEPAWGWRWDQSWWAKVIAYEVQT